MQDILYNLYEFVPVGGYVIFDDIGNGKDHGVRRLWNDFKSEQKLPETLKPGAS